MSKLEKRWSQITEAQKMKEQMEAETKKEVIPLNRKLRRRIAALKRRANRKARKDDYAARET